MSLPVIDDMVEALGYSEMFMNYYYKIPNMDISNGLKPIQSDVDVQKMCNFVPKARLLDMYIEELFAEEALTKEQHFMESMECTDPSTVVIEELSDEERDVMAITCKPRKRKGLLAIEGPSDNKGVSVKKEVTVMCSDDGFHQEEVASTSWLKLKMYKLLNKLMNKVYKLLNKLVNKANKCG
ncbi:hypothetical protein ACFX2I_009414 [Malus domestica]